MGRLGKASRNTPIFRVQYRKLIDEYSSCETVQFMSNPPFNPDFLAYPCGSCGNQLKLKAEELNSIVGNALRMAYAAQLQRQSPFQEVTAPTQSQDVPESFTTKFSPGSRLAWAKQLLAPSAPNPGMEMNLQVQNSPNRHLNNAVVKLPPASIPGLRSNHSFNVLGPTTEPKSESQQSTPSSEESNSPTEMNSYKRLADKPPLIKRIAMGLTSNQFLSNDEDNLPLVQTGSTPNSPVSIQGYTNVIETSEEVIKNSENVDKTELKRISQTSSGSTTRENVPTPPPLPERFDSLNCKDEGELRKAPWFQAGIPREITLEVLAQESVGAFMVRESTSKPGCYALSLRVPRDFQPSGIAHYLIMRTNKGYKIKGFTKEFTTLTSLITHHSVMPELLPVPLNLSRFNPSFKQSETNRDFADIDTDPDYNTLADFRKMMQDLNV